MAEDSHNPGSIDHISILYPAAATFLTKRIAHQRKIRRARLRKARAAHGTDPSGVPKPPVQTFPAKFECQLCSKVINLSKPSEWTAHVYEDLKPFTCTYEYCDNSVFKWKSDWLRHEKTHQLAELWVCMELSATETELAARKFSGACLEGHVSSDDFQLHLQRAHEISDDRARAMVPKCHYIQKNPPGDKRQLDLWICRELSGRKPTGDSGKTPSTCLKGHVRKDNLHQHLKKGHQKSRAGAMEECHYIKANPENEPCPFCGEIEFKRLEERTNHLASHLEDIFLQDVAHEHQQQNQKLYKQKRKPKPKPKRKRQRQQNPKKGACPFLLPKNAAVPVSSLLQCCESRLAALAQVCEIIQTCQWSGVDAVHHDVNLQLNYSVRNIRIGIQSATLLQDNNEEAEMEDDTNIEDGTDEEEMEVDNSQHPTQAMGTRKRFTLEETEILVELRETGWRWEDIARELKGHHSAKSLRTHYSRLKIGRR
jgi:hypothetical protein